MRIQKPPSGSHIRTNRNLPDITALPSKPAGSPIVQFGSGSGNEPARQSSNGIIAMLKGVWDIITQFFSTLWNMLFGSTTKTPEKPPHSSTPPTFPSHHSNLQDENLGSSRIGGKPKRTGVTTRLSHTEQPKPASPTSSKSRPTVVQETESPEDDELPLQSVEEAVLEGDLHDARGLFIHYAEGSSGTESTKITNSIRYGWHVFEAVKKRLVEAQPSLDQTVLKDVEYIARESYAISLETAQKESFSDLRSATQDRMINLIQFALKHPEPLIQQTGVEMAQALGISEATIERLRNE